MKQLLEYINEHQLSLGNFINEELIYEGSTIGNDIGHFFHMNKKTHSYDYPINIITKLLNNQVIHTGKDGNGPELTIDDFNIDKLKALLKQLQDKSLDPSKDNGIEMFNNCLKHDNTKFNSYKSLWGAIHKVDAKTGTNDGWAGEILTCCMYNNLYNDTFDLEKIANILELTSVDKETGEKTTNQSWMESARLSAEKLNSMWNSAEYIAIQVSGEEYTYKDKSNDINAYLKEADKIGYPPKTYSISNNENILAILYNDKNKAGKILGLNLDELYAKSKDAWNKADIILIAKDFNIEEELYSKIIKSYIKSDSGPVVTDADSYNNLLISLADTNRIIPVSLKKVIGSASLSEEGTKQEPTALQFIDDDVEIECILPDMNDLKKNNINPFDHKSSSQYNRLGSVYIGDMQNKNISKVQFRRRNPKNGTKDEKINYGTLIIELMGKNAREGRGLENIKNELLIKNNSDYLNYYGFEELEDHFGNKLDLSKQETNNIIKVNKEAEQLTYEYYKKILDSNSFSVFKKYTNPQSKDYIINWFKKPCFAGFAGLHNLWYNKKYIYDIDNNNKEPIEKTLNAFYTFLVGCCKGLITGNNYIGKYWLIK